MAPTPVIAIILALTFGLLSVTSLQATTLFLPPSDVDVVGHIDTTTAFAEDTLLDIARRYDFGQDEIVLANPDVDRWLPGEGTTVVLPGRYVLPKAKRKGLVLNLPEMRLYFFTRTARGKPTELVTHPVSVGRMDWKTPLGRTKIVSKQKDPSWYPPQSLKDEAAADGEVLPDVVKPGPDNPLGRYAIRLGLPGYLIHSTNKPFGVGMRVTHGCVRMYPEDIEVLFDQIPVGTPVQIVNQPVKAGWLADTLFLEVHPPLEEDASGDFTELVMNTIADAISDSGIGRQVTLSGRAIRKAMDERTGMPVAISR